MQHLRIVGVNDEENVPQLILSDDSGQEYALPVDEALRHAAARPAVRPSKPSPAQNPLTPREIQARLRAGSTVDEVVAASGLSTAHVERYAGPVHAEREYMAQRARATQVAPASAADAHRQAFGDEPASLEAMVRVQLKAMDVEPSTLSWDSWRREDGRWQITCSFDVDSSATHGAGIGLKPPAEWTFQPDTLQLRAANRWAESLSVLSATGQTPVRSETGGQPSAAERRLSAVDSVFDVEDPVDPRELGASASTARRAQPQAGSRSSRTSAQQGGSPPRGDSAARGEGREHEDLLDVLRARRGQRLGADAEADDRLALMLNRQDPQDRPAGPTEQDDAEHSTVPLPRLRPVQDSASEDEATEAETETETSETESAQTGASQPQASEASGSGAPEDAEPSAASRASGSPTTGEGVSPDGLDAWGFAYEGESEDRGAAAVDEPTGPAEDSAEIQDPTAAEKPRKRAPARRASMPKWDDILFGSKND